MNYAQVERARCFLQHPAADRFAELPVKALWGGMAEMVLRDVARNAVVGIVGIQQQFDNAGLRRSCVVATDEGDPTLGTFIY